MIDPVLLRGVTNATNYRILTYLAFMETRGSAHPVLLVGVDLETTRIVRDLCEADGRLLVSLEEDILAAAALRDRESKNHEVLCSAWETAPIEARGPWSVTVLDHAPGERRKDEAARLAERCEVVVIHDTEPDADRGYQLSTIWHKFRQKVDVKSNGAWASAVSNSRDLSAWRGTRVGSYVVTMGDEDVGEDQVSVKIERAFGEREEAADRAVFDGGS